jgi:hypothetical protein
MSSMNNYKKIKAYAHSGNLERIVALTSPNYYDNCCFFIACTKMNIPMMEHFYRTSQLNNYCTPGKIFASLITGSNFKGALWMAQNYPNIDYSDMSTFMILFCKECEHDLMEQFCKVSDIVVSDETILRCLDIVVQKNRMKLLLMLFNKFTKQTIHYIDALYGEYVKYKKKAKITSLHNCINYINMKHCIKLSKSTLCFDMIEFLMSIDCDAVCKATDDICQFLIVNKQYKLASQCINKSPDYNRDYRMLWACNHNCIEDLILDKKINEDLVDGSEFRLIILCIQCEAQEKSAIWLINNRISSVDVALIWGHVFKYKRVEILKHLIYCNIIPDTHSLEICLTYGVANKLYHMVILVLDTDFSLIRQGAEMKGPSIIKNYCLDKIKENQEFNVNILGPMLNGPFEDIVRSVKHDRYKKDVSYFGEKRARSKKRMSVTQNPNINIDDEMPALYKRPSINTPRKSLSMIDTICANEFVPKKCYMNTVASPSTRKMRHDVRKIQQKHSDVDKNTWERAKQSPRAQHIQLQQYQPKQYQPYVYMGMPLTPLTPYSNSTNVICIQRYPPGFGDQFSPVSVVPNQYKVS